jgi:inner membrane protein
MTTPNHITGGIVFTGIFCSFFSINIFSNPVYIIATIIGALLPDIDHTRSIIGKTVYPLAKWLATNYGHRTITHSIIFLLAIYCISIFFENIFSQNLHLSTILFFSVFSHLLFDMVTIQGIPLFYPFYKNPCVLPANPSFRITTGNIHQEAIILFAFCFLTFSLQDLFANGFWSTLNNKFDDVKHQIREFKTSEKALLLNYDFTNYQKHYKGKNYIIHANDNTLFIQLKNDILTIEKNAIGIKINSLKTTKSNKTILKKTIKFQDYTEQKLNHFLKSKFIEKATIYSKNNTSIIDNPNEFKKKFELENKYNIAFKSFVLDSVIAHKNEKIKELELSLKTEQNQLINENKKYFLAKEKLNFCLQKLNKTTSDFETNEIKKDIITLEKDIKSFVPKTNLLIEKYKSEIDQIKQQKIKDISYSGQISYIEIQ